MNALSVKFLICHSWRVCVNFTYHVSKNVYITVLCCSIWASYYASLPMAALHVTPRPSVWLSVRPSVCPYVPSQPLTRQWNTVQYSNCVDSLPTWVLTGKWLKLRSLELDMRKVFGAYYLREKCIDWRKTKNAMIPIPRYIFCAIQCGSKKCVLFKR